MARILRSESSLLRRQRAIGRELSRSKTIRIAVWGAGLAILLASGLHFAHCRTYGSLLAGAVAIVLAAGYEVHLREITAESRNLEGGRRGERKIASLLAERLADDHVILNDLEFRIGLDRCQIDHLVIAPSGIYVIESKYWGGTLTGDAGDTQWTQRRANGATKMVKSPVLQVERQRRMFITVLTDPVPDDRIFALAVFSHPKVKLNITRRENRAFHFAEAIRFINDRCFDPPVLSPAQVGALAGRINRGQA